MAFQVSKNEANWSEVALKELSENGAVVVTDVLSLDFCLTTKKKMYVIFEKIKEQVGEEKLSRAGENGVLRLMMTMDDHFFKFLEIPEMLEIIDNYLSPTCIMHLQNGFILPPSDPNASEKFQYRMHRDFKRFLNGYKASVNTLFAIDDFTENNGATRVLPGTHKIEDPPTDKQIKDSKLVCCPAGSMICFDSKLYHSATSNESGKDRCAINHQWTQSFFKQQFDYIRAIGKDKIDQLPARSQQLLGAYTQVVTSLAEYYVPADRRLYRANQG